MEPAAKKLGRMQTMSASALMVVCLVGACRSPAAEPTQTPDGQPPPPGTYAQPPAPTGTPPPAGTGVNVNACPPDGTRPCAAGLTCCLMKTGGAPQRMPDGTYQGVTSYRCLPPPCPPPAMLPSSPPRPQ
jgi:hypothetical protein